MFYNEFNLALESFEFTLNYFRPTETKLIYIGSEVFFYLNLNLNWM